MYRRSYLLAPRNMLHKTMLSSPVYSSIYSIYPPPTPPRPPPFPPPHRLLGTRLPSRNQSVETVPTPTNFSRRATQDTLRRRCCRRCCWLISSSPVFTAWSTTTDTRRDAAQADAVPCAQVSEESAQRGVQHEAAFRPCNRHVEDVHLHGVSLPAGRQGLEEEEEEEEV